MMMTTTILMMMTLLTVNTIDLGNLDFEGLKSQFDVKKANFRGLLAKIGHLWPFWLLEPTFDPFS